jgi:hypothetical protein
MRRLFISVCIMMVTAPLFAQFPVSDSLRTVSGGLYQPRKYDYGASLGSEFTSFSGYGSALSTYISPHVYYNVSKRFRIGGGISVVNTNYFNARSWYQNEQQTAGSGSFTNASIYVSGQYLVSDRLTFSGSAFKLFPVTKDPLTYNPFNPVSGNGAQGINFRVDYKVGKNMHIQAGFRYTKGMHPYAADPFCHDSFMSDSFGQQTGFGSPQW